SRSRSPRRARPRGAHGTGSGRAVPARYSRAQNARRCRTALSGGRRSPLSAKQALKEVVKVIPPVRGVVGVAVHIPDVRHVLLLEIAMHSLADADQPVLVSTRKIKQLQPF